MRGRTRVAWSGWALAVGSSVLMASCGGEPETPGAATDRATAQPPPAAVDGVSLPSFSLVDQTGARFGSADKVVFPVPESPKKMAVLSPLVLAEQCMGRMPFLGRMRFITEKIDFLISPA